MDLFFHLKHKDTLVDHQYFTIQKELQGTDFQNIKDFVEIGLNRRGLCQKSNQNFKGISAVHRNISMNLLNSSFVSVESKEVSTRFEKVRKVPMIRYLTCGLYGRYIDQIFFMVEMERTKFTLADPRIALRISYEEKLIESYYWIDVVILCRCRYYQREEIVEEFKLFWNEEDLQTSEGDTSLMNDLSGEEEDEFDIEDDQEDILKNEIIQLEMGLEDCLKNIEGDDAVEFVQMEMPRMDQINNVNQINRTGNQSMEYGKLTIDRRLENSPDVNGNIIYERSLNYDDESKIQQLSYQESNDSDGVPDRKLVAAINSRSPYLKKKLFGKKKSKGFVKSMADGSLYVESLKSHDGPNANFNLIKNFNTQKEKKLTQLNNYIIYSSTFDLYAAAEKKISKLSKENMKKKNYGKDEEKDKKTIKTFMVPESEAMKTFNSQKKFSSFMPEFKPPEFARDKKITVIESVIDLSHLNSSIETVKTKFCDVEYDLKIFLSKEPYSLGKEVYCRNLQFLKTTENYLDISHEKLSRLMTCIQLQIDERDDVIMLPYANIKLV